MMLPPLSTPVASAPAANAATAPQPSADHVQDAFARFLDDAQAAAAPPGGDAEEARDGAGSLANKTLARARGAARGGTPAPGGTPASMGGWLPVTLQDAASLQHVRAATAAPAAVAHAPELQAHRVHHTDAAATLERALSAPSGAARPEGAPEPTKAPHEPAPTPPAAEGQPTAPPAHAGAPSTAVETVAPQHAAEAGSAASAPTHTAGAADLSGAVTHAANPHLATVRVVSPDAGDLTLRLRLSGGNVTMHALGGGAAALASQTAAVAQALGQHGLVLREVKALQSTQDAPARARRHADRQEAARNLSVSTAVTPTGGRRA